MGNPTKENSYPCKGAAGEACALKVTYAWDPIYTLTEDKVTQRPTTKATKTVYLTCAAHHTNAYLVDAQGTIIG